MKENQFVAVVEGSKPTDFLNQKVGKYEMKVARVI